MPELPRPVAPGVFVQEVPAGAPSIEGVSTTTVGFAGATERGPLEPRLITSWSEFQHRYGSFIRTNIGGQGGAVGYLPHAVQAYFENGGHRCYVARVGPALDATAYLQALDALDALAELADISLLTVPDEVHFPPDVVTEAVLVQCERSKDRFAILSSRRDAATPDQIRAHRPSQYAALYHPWVRVPDATLGADILVPPHGHVAGVYGRVDTERGVHKSPANEVLRGVTSLQSNVDDSLQAMLNTMGVSCIRHFPGRGIRVWGARTISDHPEWKYVNVRRFITFLEVSIGRGLQWAVFEPNNESTWSRVRWAIENFLHQHWRNGALLGARPSDAYFVRCDATTMTAADMESGRLVALVGVAMLRPAEFVIIRIQQATAGGG